MSKKRSWFSLIKRLLFPETHHHQQKQKIKRRRWMFGKVLKGTKTLSSITTSSPTQAHEALQKPEQNEEEQKHMKCDKHNNYEDDVAKRSLPSQVKLQETIINEVKLSSLDDEKQNYVENLAAIKIQTIYRGYLARKALRALKGFVRLQAIIRGRAVRRQAMTTLKCLQSIAKIQSEVCARRCQMIRSKDGELQLQLQDLRIESPKLQVYRQRRKDSELLTKEEQINIILRKKEAILRSQRAKAYSFNHRHSADSEDGISQGRLRNWLEHYVSEESSKKDDKNNGQQRFRHIDGLNIFDISTLPRRSYHKHKKQNSYGGEDYLQSSSPINLPTYMASTESAKAKTRSLSSSPRLRPLHIDPYSDNDNSPYKNKLSPMSSINSEATCSGFSKVSNKSSNFSSSQQKSPSFKGVSGPIRSKKSFK